MHKSTFLAMSATAVAALVLTGCTVTTSSDEIDPDKVLKSLQDELPGSVITLQCPESIPFEAGLVTVCPATLDGANAVVTITQVNDEGLADFAIGKFLNVDALPSLVEAEVGVPVEVQCPADVPLEAGLVVECLVYDGESEGVVLVTQKDNIGNISWTFG